MTARAEAQPNMASMPVPIATGQMTVSVSTNVTYELKVTL